MTAVASPERWGTTWCTDVISLPAHPGLVVFGTIVSDILHQVQETHNYNSVSLHIKGGDITPSKDLCCMRPLM